MTRLGIRLGASLVAATLGLPMRPAAAPPGPIAAHPRVWLTPTRLAKVRALAAARTVRWQRLKAVADNELRDTSTSGVEEYIPVLSLAYIGSGNAAYCGRVGQILQALAVGTNTYRGDSYYAFRSAIPDIATGLDWCYDRITVPLRQQVATWLMDRADDVWPETNPSRASGWGVANPANNYFYGFLMTWPAALAAAGDDTGVGSVSGSKRPAFHIELARSKFRTLVVPFMSGWGSGGVFAESTNYDSTERLAKVLDAHLTATGEDLINGPAQTFLRDTLLWRIYSTVPGRDQYYSLGDQPRESSGALSPYDRGRALIVQHTLADPALRQQMRYWLDTIDPSGTSESWYQELANELLYYDETVTATDYSTLPTSYFAPGAGILTNRSNWGPSATYFGIWAGPYRESHQLADVNGFLIYKGGWLLGNGNMYSSSGIEESTALQNNLTFGSFWQQPQVPGAGNVPTAWPHDAGTALKHAATPEYTYFEGQASQAYVQDRPHEGVRIASDYARKFLYLQAIDAFVVYDRVTLVNAYSALDKTLHLQSRTRPTVNGRNYVFDNGTYKVFGQSVLPLGNVSVSSAPVMKGPSSAASSYQVNVVTAGNRATDYMLNVLQVAPIAHTSPLSVKGIHEEAGRMDGVQIGEWVVMMGRGDHVTQAIQYSASGAEQHLIVDLRAAAAYQIQTRDTGGAALRTFRATADADGQLRFSSEPGERTFTLTPAALIAAARAPTKAPGGV